MHNAALSGYVEFLWKNGVRFIYHSQDPKLIASFNASSEVGKINLILFSFMISKIQIDRFD
jgi:hypothetical protein